MLKPAGTCWVNLGDTYWSAKGSCFNPGGGRHSLAALEKGIYPLYRGNRSDIPWLAPKSLCQIPSRFAIGMCNRGWILRNEIIWHKPNCMPSSIKDRFTVDFEKLFLFVKNRRYFFETQYEPWTDHCAHDIRRALFGHKPYEGKWKQAPRGMAFPESNIAGNPFSGRNKRSVWRIPTQPFPGAHFAVYPEALVDTPIKAGCPALVCKKCGKARMVIYDAEFVPQDDVCLRKNKKASVKGLAPGNGWGSYPRGATTHRLGEFSNCGCRASWNRGIVLDPFAGAGTTCVVAERLGRDWIGIDINPRYCEMARRRIAQARTIAR